MPVERSFLGFDLIDNSFFQFSCFLWFAKAVWGLCAQVPFTAEEKLQLRANNELDIELHACGHLPMGQRRRQQNHQTIRQKRKKYRPIGINRTKKNKILYALTKIKPPTIHTPTFSEVR